MYCLNHPDRITEGTTDKCASCNRLERKAANLRMPEDPKPINKVSENQSKLLTRYNVMRKKFLHGKKCAVLKGRPATQVHHMAGRIGYADEWARENNIPLLIDERFFLPVSDEGHRMVTDNPKWACENGYSFLRVTDPVFIKQQI